MSSQIQKHPPQPNDSRASRSMIVVDDLKIRLSAFQSALALLKKMDTLEVKISNFHKADQKQFEEWLNLSFRNEKQLIQNKRDELDYLSRFHNWMIALSDLKDITLAEAYWLLKEEEKAFASGSPEFREGITKSRNDRDRFIESEVRKEFERQQDELRTQLEEENEELSKTESPFSGLGQLEAEEALNRLLPLSDKELSGLLKSHDIVFKIMTTVLFAAQNPEHFRLFLRMWDLLSAPLRRGFAKSCAFELDISLEEIIRDMRKATQDAPDEEKSKYFFNEEAVTKSSKLTSPVEVERFKLLYRKLVRRLHPDLQNNPTDVFTAWQKKLWARAQEAHKSGDVDEVEWLYQLTLLREGTLSEMTVAEIKSSTAKLQFELKNLEKETKDLRKLPAWGFSTKRSFAAVEKKQRKQLLTELDSLEDQLADMKREYEIFELMNPEMMQKQRHARGEKPKARKGQADPRFSRKK